MEKQNDVTPVAEDKDLSPEEIEAINKQVASMSADELKATGMYVEAATDERGEAIRDEDGNLILPEPPKLSRQARRAQERNYKKMEKQLQKIQDGTVMMKDLTADKKQQIFTIFLRKMKAKNLEFEKLAIKDKTKDETKTTE